MSTRALPDGFPLVYPYSGSPTASRASARSKILAPDDLSVTQRVDDHKAPVRVHTTRPAPPLSTEPT